MILLGTVVEVKNEDILKVGDCFTSFEKLKQKLDDFQRATSTSFFIRDCCTTSASKKKEIRREIDQLLKYYRIKYSCVKGGKKFKSKGKGMRDSA